MPGEMRLGSFKVATETLAGLSCSRPEAGADLEGWQCCRAVPGMEQAWDRPVWGQRGQILTFSQPFLPQTCGKGNGASTEQGTVGPAVLHWGGGNLLATTASPCTPALTPHCHPSDTPLLLLP